ncbi:unnamed protein product [Cladocopium goreaui]|uniref:Uncharacterized protein n=1 Tax=Cladocopium goreaui TaxID=2562237 RepID=A0A9P1DK19_9DINO|nr:unnamed protein product [Cladocopium goreaui]
MSLQDLPFPLVELNWDKLPVVQKTLKLSKTEAISVLTRDDGKPAKPVAKKDKTKKTQKAKGKAKSKVQASSSKPKKVKKTAVKSKAKAMAKSGGKSKGRKEKTVPTDIGPHGFDEEEEEEPHEVDEELQAESAEVTRKRKEPIAPPPADVPARKATKPNADVAETPEAPEAPAAPVEPKNAMAPEASLPARAADAADTQDGTLWSCATLQEALSLLDHQRPAETLKDVDSISNELENQLKHSSSSSAPGELRRAIPLVDISTPLKEYPDNQEGLTPSASPTEPEIAEPNGPLPDGAAAPLPEPNAGEVPEPVNAAVPELAQKAAEQIEQAGMEALIQPPAVEPAEKTVDHPIESPAVVEPAEEKAGEGADTTPAGPPDRTLELAGLQALMKNHETRLQIQNQNAVAKAKQQAEGSPKGPAPTEVNWSSHKKEGMRLKRLMEESSEGAKFPHMQKLWGGSAADRKQLLQQWVASNSNAQSIEADLVLSKHSANQHKSTRELLTTQEMQKRDIPIEKIRAIVARGNGVPDPDCPGIASLTRFWVSTSTKEIDTDEVKMESSVRMQADASSTLAAIVPSAAPSSSCSRAIGADGMQQILQSLQAPSVDEGSVAAAPKTKAKAKAKVKAKAKAASVTSSGVSEVPPKTMDEMKAEISHGLSYSQMQHLISLIHICHHIYIFIYLFIHPAIPASYTVCKHFSEVAF